MSIEVFWRLPVNGDGRSFRQEDWTRGDFRAPPSWGRSSFARTEGRHERYTYFDHLAQVARAAESSGFDGVHIPQTAEGEEPLIVAGALARELKRITLAPALPAHFLSAVYAAKISTSFQRLTKGRLALNLVTEAPGEHPWHGYRWSVEEQIARAGEFLDVLKGFWNDGPFTYHGQYYEVENGGFAGPLKGQPLPIIYLSGDTDAALALSARHADVHILAAEDIGAVRETIARLDALAAEHGRKLRYALDAEVIARHTDGEAWDYVRSRWSDADGDFDALKVGPNLWTGFGGLRAGGPAAGLVGSYDEVAERLADYRAAGVDTFILGTNPHLEEAYRIGQHLLPRLRGEPARQVA